MLTDRKIKIELKSDLCAGSGYSYAGIIDSDICYDEFGFPYIPAKRLKGCMREAAETVLSTKYKSDEIENFFGRPGDYNGNRGSFTLGNAYIVGYDAISEQVREARNNGLEQYCTTEQILSQYTRVIGQTKMKDGVADATTLRFTRVVNRFAPPAYGGQEPEPMCFIVDVSYDETDGDMLKDILNATRHIGLKRNRGMGNVRCSFVDVGTNKIPEKGGDKEVISSYVKVEQLKDGYVKLSYAVRNVQPLMISGMEEEVSESYISGQQVLGLMAGRYLEAGGVADSDEFRELFLGEGKTRFSNLYPFDGRRIYYPAPEYVNCLKKTKKYVFTLQRTLPEQPEMDRYNYQNGNQPKKLKGKFVSVETDNSKKTVCIYDVKKDIIYHHRRGKGGEDGILYTGEAIREGQMFAGSVAVPEKYKTKIIELLTKGDMYFGKSRSAQYGRCVLTEYADNRDENDSKLNLTKGDDVVITFLSDIAVLNDKGDYTILRDDVIKTVGDSCFGEKGWERHDSYISCIQTGLVTGFSGIWGLRKSPVPVVRAGGCISLRLKDDYKGYNERWIGERTVDGLGHVRIDRAEEYCYENYPNHLKSGSTEDGVDPCGIAGNGGAVGAWNNHFKGMLAEIAAKDWLEQQINKSLKDKKLSGITNAAAGRFKLMLVESMDAENVKIKMENRDYQECHSNHNESCSENYQVEWWDFNRRILSIKSDGTRRYGKALIKSIREIFGLSHYETDDKGDLVLKEGEKSPNIGEKLGSILQFVEKDMLCDKIKSRWGDFAMAIIVDRKYNGGGER